MLSETRPLKVGIGGLGAIGLPVARWLDAGVPGLELVAVASSSIEKAQTLVREFRAPPLAGRPVGLPARLGDATPYARGEDPLTPFSKAASLDCVHPPRISWVRRQPDCAARAVAGKTGSAETCQWAWPFADAPP